ncbi:hypothetical protein SLS54_010710, partial [Diplodia seriata]
MARQTTSLADTNIFNMCKADDTQTGNAPINDKKPSEWVCCQCRGQNASDVALWLTTSKILRYMKPQGRE